MPGWRLLNRRFRVFSTDWSERVVIHDLRKKLPWDDESISAIYSSHTLEHLTKSEGHQLMRECYRVLSEGSRIRIVVPDLADIVARYTAGSLAADDFVHELGVGSERSGSLLRDFAKYSISFPHQCMYDTESLVRLLTEVGFTAERRKPYDTDIPDVADVELEERVVDAVIVEGAKL
jgi:predicted SAM-dependent methyltransferase